MHDFNLLYTLITIVVVLGGILSLCAVLILVERKVAAYVQDRCGPNRVGPMGLLQPLADGLKFLLKEDVIPKHVDRFLYLHAQSIGLMTALLAFVVVPFGPPPPPPEPPKMTAQAEMDDAEKIEAIADYKVKAEEYGKSYQFIIAPNIDVGIVLIFAISSLAVYAVILGGYAGNNKYSFIGGLRASAQVISYEIPLGLSVIGVIIMSGSLNLERIIWNQVPDGNGETSFVFIHPHAFLIFMVSAFAETNRLPFDLAEAEQELVGGFHTEYSAMKFAMFFLGEYTHMVTTSFLMVILFFGGWHFPFIAGADSFWLLKLAVFLLKMGAFILFFMLIRWTLPRFRFDQLMGLAWKVLIPLSLANLVCVMIIKELGWTLWLLLPVSIGLLIGAAAIGASSPPKTRPRKELVTESMEPANV